MVSELLLSDHALVRRLADGERSALEVLYDRHGSRAYSLALLLCGHARLAETAVSAAFVSVWERRAHFDRLQGGDFESWLIAVLHRACRDLMSERGPVHPVDYQEGMLPRSDEDFKVDLGARRVRDALDALAEEERTFLLSVYLGRSTPQQLAERFGVEPREVRRTIAAGLDAIAARLEQRW